MRSQFTDYTDCSQSLVFPCMRSNVDVDGPPSWSPDASKTGESTKYPWDGVVEGT